MGSFIMKTGPCVGKQKEFRAFSKSFSEAGGRRSTSKIDNGLNLGRIDRVVIVWDLYTLHFGHSFEV